MSSLRTIIRLLASVTALVLFTGVALPAAATLCMVPEMQAEPETELCHSEDSEHDDAPPLERGLECCHLGSEAVFDEAVVVKVDTAPVLQPTVRAALTSELAAPPDVAVSEVLHQRPGGITPPAALHILYAVMLN